MSSLGTFRSVERAWEDYQACLKSPSETTETVRCAYGEWQIELEIHQDCVQAEYEDALADEDER